MARLHRGKQSVVFENAPSILSTAAIGSKKEAEGPLRQYFDFISEDTKFGQASWEKAESQMQTLAMEHALKKAKLSARDIDMAFAGDLLNQCISTTFSLRDTEIPLVGLYGACSTMAESIALAAMSVAGGYCEHALAMTSSNFASAERQYRFPLVYGGQRTPTAQWTVTGAGCVILAPDGSGPYITSATIGKIVDWGITDSTNMGAAMAPSAYETIRQHLSDLKKSPEDYDLIVTGDLGSIGKEIVTDLFQKDGIDISKVYDDCGVMVYDLEAQDVHAGGSGCGCSASVFCGYLMEQMRRRKWNRILLCGTGALLSTLSAQQGESIPGVCHAVSVAWERG